MSERINKIVNFSMAAVEKLQAAMGMGAVADARNINQRALDAIGTRSAAVEKIPLSHFLGQPDDTPPPFQTPCQEQKDRVSASGMPDGLFYLTFLPTISLVEAAPTVETIEEQFIASVQRDTELLGNRIEEVVIEEAFDQLPNKNEMLGAGAAVIRNFAQQWINLKESNPNLQSISFPTQKLILRYDSNAVEEFAATSFAYGENGRLIITITFGRSGAELKTMAHEMFHALVGFPGDLSTVSLRVIAEAAAIISPAVVLHQENLPAEGEDLHFIMPRRLINDIWLELLNYGGLKFDKNYEILPNGNRIDSESKAFFSTYVLDTLINFAPNDPTLRFFVYGYAKEIGHEMVILMGDGASKHEIMRSMLAFFARSRGQVVNLAEETDHFKAIIQQMATDGSLSADGLPELEKVFLIAMSPAEGIVNGSLDALRVRKLAAALHYDSNARSYVVIYNPSVSSLERSSIDLHDQVATYHNPIITTLLPEPPDEILELYTVARNDGAPLTPEGIFCYANYSENFNIEGVAARRFYTWTTIPVQVDLEPASSDPQLFESSQQPSAARAGQPLGSYANPLVQPVAQD